MRRIAYLSLLIGLLVLGVSVAIAQQATEEPESASPTAEPVLTEEAPSLTLAAEPTGDNSYCLVCHAQEEHGQVMLSGVHQEELGCVDCHGEQAFPHGFSAVLNTDQNACTDCHAESAQQVAEGTHAGLNADLSQTTCLDCHGAHEVHPVEEMSCNTCHGETVHQFEAEQVSFHTNQADCETCHEVTVHEWENSPHGEQQLACATCHIPDNTQAVRFGGVNHLCLNCHDNQDRDNFTHLVHSEQTCSNCHLYTESNLREHVQNDGVVLSSGHSMSIPVAACIDCHTDESGGEIAESDNATERGESHPLLVTQTRIEMLEADIETAREEEGGAAAVRLAQSTLVGLAFGAVLVWLFNRYRVRQTRKGE